MEVKKIILFLLTPFVMLFLCSCSINNSEVICEKNYNDENYNYNISMKITFNENDIIKKINSNVTYTLTLKGMENINDIITSLDNKANRHSLDDNVKLSYSIVDNIITINELIKLDSKTDISLYSDLSAVYISDKNKKEDILQELENTNIICK